MFDIYYVNGADREENKGCYLSYCWIHEHFFLALLKKKERININ